MKKRFKIILSIILPIICITSVCLSFLMPSTKADPTNPNIEQTLNAEDTGASRATKDKKGGALYIENGSTYTMTGGSITGVCNVYGGAVYVANGGTFNMNAGTITGCQAKYGGAIYVENGGVVNISNGTITGNGAKNAPAIYVEEGGILNVDDATIIEDNTYFDWFSPLDYISADKTVVVGNPSENFSLPYIDFGSYPQWYVGNSMNETLENWYTTNNPTAVNTYVIRTRTWQAYQYTDGNIYARGNRCVLASGYTYLNGEDVGPSSTTEFTWFKVDPIRWVVLNWEEIEAGTAASVEVRSYLALTADITFNASSTDPDGIAGTADDPNQWAYSDIREWLNGSFYNSAFDKNERMAIEKANVGNNITGNYDSETSNTTGIATVDKVYLLSYWDCCNPRGIFKNAGTRRLVSPTDFSLANRCQKITDSSYITATYINGGTCRYRLRTAGVSSGYLCAVDYYGAVYYDNVLWNDYNSVCPALQLSLQ